MWRLFWMEVEYHRWIKGSYGVTISSSCRLRVLDGNDQGTNLSKVTPNISSGYSLGTGLGKNVWNPEDITLPSTREWIISLKVSVTQSNPTYQTFVFKLRWSNLWLLVPLSFCRSCAPWLLGRCRDRTYRTNASAGDSDWIAIQCIYYCYLISVEVLGLKPHSILFCYIFAFKLYDGGLSMLMNSQGENTIPPSFAYKTLHNSIRKLIAQDAV